MAAQLSNFARSLSAETAFDVLAVAKTLKAAGKDVIELQIGDSPFPSTASARAAGIEAIEDEPDALLPLAGPALVPRGGGASSPRGVRRPGRGRERRRRRRAPRCSSSSSARRSSTPATPCWSSARTSRPTCRTSSAAARAPCLTPLRQENDFRPDLERRRAVRRATTRRRGRSSSTRRTTRPAASRPRTTCSGIADLVRGTQHRGLQRRAVLPHGLAAASTTRCWRQPGMLDSASAAYTFSKSYSMSGWRLGYAVASRRGRRCHRQDDQHVAVVRAADRAARRAGGAGARRGRARRGRCSSSARRSNCWSTSCAQVAGVTVLDAGRHVLRLPERLADLPAAGHHSHGLAMYLLEGADDKLGVGLPGRRVLRRRPGRASCASAAPSRTSGCGRRSISSRRRSRAPTGSRRGSTRTRSTGWRVPTPSNSARKARRGALTVMSNL